MKKIIVKSLKGEKTPFTLEKNLIGDIAYFEEPIGISFVVSGTVIDSTLATEFSFDKEFLDLASAEQYFEALKAKYPFSEILLTKKTYQEIKIYA